MHVYTLMRFTPMRCTLIRGTLMKYTAMRCMLVRYMLMSHTPVRRMLTRYTSVSSGLSYRGQLGEGTEGPRGRGQGG